MTDVAFNVGVQPNSTGLWGTGDEVAYNNTNVGAGGAVGTINPDPPVLVGTSRIMFVGAQANIGVKRFGVVVEGVHAQNTFVAVQYLNANSGNAPVSLNAVDAEFNTGPFAQSGFTTWSWVTASYSWPADLTTFTSVTNMPTVTLAVPTLIDGTGVLLEWAPASLGSSIVEGYSVWRDGENVSGDLDSVTLTYSDQTSTPNTPFAYVIHMHLLEENDVISNERIVTTGDLVEVFNCACELVSTYDTLATLRTRMAIQCGYAAMSSNLPAGQATEFNEYLRTSQKQLYKKYFEQRTTRFFRWTMVPGERYYGINASEGDCNLFADPLAIKWVGFEDLNRAWYQLVEGIDPVYYTRANINFGWPSRYEIRSCIEIFPAPQAAYTLWVKADITLAPFSVDADRTTIDDEAVLLFAVANWKAAKGKPAADVAMNQATARIQDLTARKHATYRYVPVTAVQNPATPPRFLPLGSQQS
jgi:hypothetical protein